MSDTIVCFTSRSVEEMLATGGSQAWRLRPAHARQAQYLVCARNRNSDWSEGPEAHLSGFLIGRVTGIVPAPEDSSRYLIQIGEWARIDRPGLWTFGRNPVRYANIAELGIDPESIEFEPLEAVAVPREIRHSRRDASFRPLTIMEAKEGLAASLGVDVNAIEITIRG